MTFLAQTEIPGLQIRMPSGNWLDVRYIPGSFAVNSGDIMKRWTNRRFKSDAAPGIADSRPSPLRYSVFFWGPASTSGSNACRPALVPTTRRSGHRFRRMALTSMCGSWELKFK
jgi:isopenicillin N synthase-like dioxygenase